MKELGVAITKDMAEIRETELDHSGHFRKAALTFTDHTLDSDDCDVFVDRLGRLVAPGDGPWNLLEEVTFHSDQVARGVVKKETRYEGDKVVALIIYLEAKGEPDA